MTNGSTTLNGITDRELIAVMEAKVKHENVMYFNAQMAQVVNTQPQPNRPVVQTYNNVMLSWQNAEGARVISELLRRLAEDRASTAAQ